MRNRNATKKIWQESIPRLRVASPINCNRIAGRLCVSCNSEIRAFDTRYLANIYPSNSPTNPDAVVNPASPNPEILPYAHRNMKNETVHAFILTLTKLDNAMVNANLKGDQFLGDIAWEALQSCAGK